MKDNAAREHKLLISFYIHLCLFSFLSLTPFRLFAWGIWVVLIAGYPSRCYNSCGSRRLQFSIPSS
ncbi:uncharacterized protein EURHEDRAFT_350086 [Aspergillus ruber CBS 135680]|uniref:Uncharacterized protein n=1 Tax=Aspergillus ruber (strain CBS 135680) TaxID=1388766 RepID=A0A017SH90_ASPRC|nr:uncharacterized protein EURHEDRAFT_350086 [Aspergillus ruber CBS 135680]EYE96337.1 hypothetical protein EURHEDRAFT_350086 [Aspergillus ruber CBS 135680]